jgi:hypothetical protein
MGMVVVALLAVNAGVTPEVTINYINLKTNQIRRKLCQALSLLLCKSVLDGDILSLDPAKFGQLLPECVYQDRSARSSALIEETYAKNFPCLLRVDHSPTEGEYESDSKDPHQF